MANIALPAVSNAFETSFSEARWIVIGYLVAATLFSPFIGVIGDSKGLRESLIGGLVLYGAGAFISAGTSDFEALVMARIVQGVGASALVVLPIAIGARSDRDAAIGRVLGVLATMSAVGTAAGPSLGGLILGAGSWSSIFISMGVLAVINSFLVFKFVPSRSLPKADRSGSSGFRDLIESIGSSASLRLQLFFTFSVSSLMMATLIVGPYYLSERLRLSPLQMGLVMSCGPVTSAISGVLSGIAVERFGARSVGRAGLVELLVGATSFATLPPAFGAVGFAISAVLLSVGYQLFSSANSMLIVNAVDSSRKGSVSGAMGLSRNLGLIGGTLIMGAVFDGFSNASLDRGLQMTFAFAAFWIGVLLILNSLLQRGRKNGTEVFDQVH